MTKDQLTQFFIEHKAINIRQFEKECGWSYDGALTKVLNGTKSITPRFIEKVYPVMLRYGLTHRDNPDPVLESKNN